MSRCLVIYIYIYISSYIFEEAIASWPGWGFSDVATLNFKLFSPNSKMKLHEQYVE